MQANKVPWNRGEKIGAISLVVAILGVIAAWLVFFVPAPKSPEPLKPSPTPQASSPSTPVRIPAVSHSASPQKPTPSPTRAALALDSCGLGYQWDETEYGYAGTWTRRDSTNIFDARWVRENDVEKATLKIEISGEYVSVKRIQMGQPVFNGTCDYDGILQKDMRSVTGIYRCSWGEEVPKWSALIRCR